MMGGRMKLLVIATLLACTFMISAARMPVGVVSNSEPFESLESAHSEPRLKRILRSDAAFTVPHRVEERALAVSLPGIDQLITSIKSGASKLIQKIKLKWWGVRNKSPDYVFTSLKLDQTGAKLFESPGFSRWVAFVTARDAKTAEETVFKTLKAHYADDALAKMLAAATEVDSTKAFAAKLQGFQFAIWADTGRTVDDVYKLMKLDKAGDNLLGSPGFSTWTSYMSKVNTKSPNEIIIAKLSDRYGDVALAKMIAAASKKDSTKKLATDLHAAQFQHWKSQGATPKSVDSLLQVTTNSDDAIKKVSADYEKFYGKVKVDTSKTSVDTAKASIDTTKISAYTATTEGFEKKADDMFDSLRLGQAGENLLQNPGFKQWTQFVTKGTTSQSTARAILFGKLYSGYYGDATLAKMFLAWTKVDDTMELATHMRTMQFEYWMARGSSAKEMDSVLNVAAKTDDAITTISQDYHKFEQNIIHRFKESRLK